jgi:hypothetical protein
MSTLRTITNFKSKLQGGGARPNLFEVNIPTFPVAAGMLELGCRNFPVSLQNSSTSCF